MIKLVPSEIIRPDYAFTGKPLKKENRILRLRKDIRRMRKSCAIAREVLSEVMSCIRIGVSTEELDSIAHEACIKRGAYPSPLNYRGFPKSICTSVNEVVCHGIPSETKILNEGDIINCDVTTFYKGYHGDCSETVAVGEVSEEIKNLIEAARQAMNVGIEAVKDGVCVSLIGRSIESFVGKKYGLVEDFCGHGVGEVFHAPPTVFHCKSDYKFILREGMTITVEPMLNLGTKRGHFLEDKWTYITNDGKPSAQFEQTILITKTGAKILTA